MKAILTALIALTLCVSASAGLEPWIDIESSDSSAAVGIQFAFNLGPEVDTAEEAALAADWILEGEDLVKAGLIEDDDGILATVGRKIKEHKWLSSLTGAVLVWGAGRAGNEAGWWDIDELGGTKDHDADDSDAGTAATGQQNNQSNVINVNGDGNSVSLTISADDHSE